MKIIIIDDEKKSVDLISSVISNNLSYAKIVAKETNPSIGIEKIKELKPDLVLLDIEMPEINGFQVIEETKDVDYSVIFITAFNQYAVTAFRYSAFDYLMKPIDIELLVKSINAVHDEMIQDTFIKPSLKNLLENLKSDKPKIITLSTDKGYHYVPVAEIIRVEADGVYSYFYLKGGRKIVVAKNIGTFEETLQDGDFFRTHRSHIVNLYFVKAYVKHTGGYIEMTDGSTVDLARQKKEDFVERMNRFIRNS